MFGDLFSVTPSQVNEANQAHAINHLALAMLLIEKGIITDDELDKARTQATHIVEQAWAEKRERAKEEFDEEHPGVRDMFQKITGLEP